MAYSLPLACHNGSGSVPIIPHGGPGYRTIGPKVVGPQESWGEREWVPVLKTSFLDFPVDFWSQPPYNTTWAREGGTTQAPSGTGLNPDASSRTYPSR